jgi:hypothetical protein
MTPVGPGDDKTRDVRAEGDFLMGEIPGMFQSGGGIDATEARLLMMKAIPLAKQQQVSTQEGLEQLLAREGMPADDAYSNAGTTEAWVSTDFGDFASGVLSKVGVRGAGDDTDADNRGNDMGEAMYDKLSGGSPAPLSVLIKQSSP